MKNSAMILVSALVAVSSAFVVGCAQPGKKTAIGAGAGAALGAGLGAIIGHQSGNKGKGAAIGAAAGALLGGTIGNRLDKQAQELAAIAETKRTEQGIITKLKSDITFSSGSSSVKPMAQSNIKQIAAIIAKYPEDVVQVIGHTDSTGSDATNQALSQKRAESVRQQMISGGVPSGSISAIGRGESQPILTNKTSNGRAGNRRVEIQISVDETKVKK